MYLNSFNKSECSGCKVCGFVCPVKAISFPSDKEGFWYPVIDETKCIKCNKCRAVCPMDKHTKEKIIDDNQVYAVYSNDKNILLKSTSGGIFTHISNEILNQNGLVFGHKYTRDCKKVYCDSATTEIQRDLFCGSKYVQSDMNNVYEQIQNAVINESVVLITGTPCQVAAVNRLFVDKPDNLLTMDIVCHGVPSPQIFETYISLLSTKQKSGIKNFVFRDKSLGWNKPSRIITYNNNMIDNIILSKDVFNFLFLSTDCILRPSCYSCPFAGTERVADVTIGDYWGIENQHPDMFNDKGTSLVIVNTSVGQDLFNRIKHLLTIKKTSLLSAQQKNDPLANPSSPYKYRNIFFKIYSKFGFELSYFFVKTIYFVSRCFNKLRRTLAPSKG